MREIIYDFVFFFFFKRTLKRKRRREFVLKRICTAIQSILWTMDDSTAIQSILWTNTKLYYDSSPYRIEMCVVYGLES